MQYLVLAFDGTDEDAPSRRQAARQEHLEATKRLNETGVVALAGAILGADGGMAGSALIVEAESEEAVRELLAADVYTRGGVWQEVTVWPFRRAV